MKKFLAITILVLLVGCTAPRYNPISRIDGGVAIHAGTQNAYEVTVIFAPNGPAMPIVTHTVARPYCHGQRLTDNVVCELSYLRANDIWNIRSSCVGCTVYGSLKRQNGKIELFEVK